MKLSKTPMKLAALYTIYNGTELLEKSINKIHDEVDLIIISWQHLSHKGNPSSESKKWVQSHKDWSDKIIFIEYTPDLTVNTKENERRKHNQMIQEAKEYDCTHFFLSACDHFYNRKQFRIAKKVCENNDIDVTFTEMFTYFKHPEWQLTPKEDYYMPFICRIHENTTVQINSKYPYRTDPSVQINTADTFYLFPSETIIMHHYSMIRENIYDKFNNAAASIRWKPEQIQRFIKEYENAKLGDKISYFQGREIIKKPNYFDI